MSRIVAVSQSKQKGTQKQIVAEGILIADYGLAGDAHADSSTNRQVSLLAIESINQVRKRGINIGPGDFAENITCDGIDLISLPVGTHLLLGNQAIIEISQIGKECHTACAIRRQVGNCIMPIEGVFGKVIRGGVIKAGDSIKVLDGQHNR